MARPEPTELGETSSSPPLSVSLEPSCRALRRRLGPLAWAVLEDVLIDASVIDGHLVAATSVRRVAANLGVTKNTAGRALARLIAEDLLRREPQHRERGGCFATSAYTVTLRDGVRVRSVDAGAPRLTTQDTVVKPKRRARGRARAAQLTLLDEPAPINNNPNHEP